MHTFSEFNLHSNISKAIVACGYTTPTPVQAKSIPEVMNGRDVVVSAQTGTGKTAAFVLPALHNLSERPASKKTRVLILTPTRELASQITKAAAIYGKFLRFNIVSLVGGMPYHNQIKDLGRGADIIVATPGRLMDHMEQKRVDLSQVEMLVLDEADRMLDMGFIDDVQYIAKLTPSKRQTLLFSATLDNKLMSAVKHLLQNPVRIDLSTQDVSAPLIKQEFYKVANIQQKSRVLKHLLNDENIFKAIIFSATKINADKLADQLCDEGFAAAALHGDLRQNVRTRTLEQLRRGKIQFLVATDVAARGIDVSDITHVINYDLPRFCEDYVHRIGRTGRAGKTGIAISFVQPTDARCLKSLERYLGKRIQLTQTTDLLESIPATKSKSRPESETLTLNRDDDYSSPKRSYRDRSDSDGKSRFKSREDFRGGDRSSRSSRDDSRSERPARAARDDFRSERPARAARDDFRSERPARSGRDDFRSERPARSARDDFRSERPARSGRDDSRSERPARSGRDDSRGERPARSGRDDFRGKTERFAKGERFAKPSRESFSGKRDRFAKTPGSDHQALGERETQSAWDEYQSRNGAAPTPAIQPATHAFAEKNKRTAKIEYKDNAGPKKRFSADKKSRPFHRDEKHGSSDRAAPRRNKSAGDGHFAAKKRRSVNKEHSVAASGSEK